ncbi:MerR family transcriptional regulator [Nocardioides cavernae]|uniref:MerR family transcriptional regulator n=1 Tax=Nocardioides cavernae TaxID=1921566 RepID=A0ABR8NH89_9ACTN|nr:MerR family transcriptional regulator [Nocardioides cavernae]
MGTGFLYSRDEAGSSRPAENFVRSRGCSVAGSDDGVYAISVAASMVSMEIQNLRVYERRGLLTPDRTAGGSRLYSDDDVVRLERIRDLLADGLNLVGIARVLELEDEVDRLRARLGEQSA